MLRTITEAIPAGHITAREVVRITWPGMKLLTLNELLRIDHRLLTQYRRACHTAVREGVWQIAHRANGLRFDAPVRVHLHRRGLRLVDADGLYAAFKFLIDGFRLAGVIRDDDPTNIVELTHSQEKGEPEIGVTITLALNGESS